MNSLYKENCHEEFGCKPFRHHPEPGDALLRANNGSLNTSVTTLATLLNPVVNQPVASVTIDTACLRSPSILVNFSGTLTSSAILAVNTTFNFTLYRVCKCSGFREQLSSFSVAQTLAAASIPTSTGLSFAYTQCNNDCEDCCTYILELTSVNALLATTITVNVSGVLSVLAVEGSC